MTAILSAPPDPTAAEPGLPLVLHLAPNGYRCGMVAVNEGACGLQVLVLPKLWKGADVDLPVAHLDREANRLVVIGHEGERIRLEGVPADWREAFIIAASGARDAALAEGDERNEREPREASEEDDAREVKELAAERRVLLAVALAQKSSPEANPATRPRRFAPWSAGSTKADEDKRAAHELEQLVRLVVLSGAFKQRPLDYRPLDRGVGYLVAEGVQRDDTLAFLNAHAFVQEVQARARDIRQGYLLREEWLPGVRGRLTARGLVRHAATGEPVVECAYDDFTAEIDLFQVIVTALAQVERGAPFPPVLREVARPLSNAASRLRRDLAHIPPIPRATAAHKAGQIRLTRLWRPWAAALHMARLLLQDRPLAFTGQQEGKGALVWSVDTSKVWEGTLAQVLRHGGHQPTAQSELVAAWKNLGDLPRPDFILHQGGRRWLLDAKYKLHAKPPEPSRDEKYQMFLYSHLPQRAEEQAPEHGTVCVLLYASPGFEIVAHARSWTRAAHWPPAETQPDVRLGSLIVPFPQPARWPSGQTNVSPLSDEGAWTRWTESHGKTLKTCLEALTTAS